MKKIIVVVVMATNIPILC